MRTIYKYELEVTDYQDIPMPLCAQILTIQVQHDKPCIWALVNTERPIQKQRIFICGTGHPYDENFDRYLGTFQLHSGSLVFHVFTYL